MSDFQRDRDRLAYFCREMLARINEAAGNEIGDIGPLARQIVQFELAERLGFTGPPLLYAERQQPGYIFVRFLIWNDPHGTTGGEIWLSAPLQKSKHDPVANHSKAEDRGRLTKVLRRWVRAVEHLPEPSVYPAAPIEINPKVEQVLWADPLWRALERAITALDDNPKIMLGEKTAAEKELNAYRLNLLVRETGLGQAVFGYSEKHEGGCLQSTQLHVYHPDHKDPVTFTIGDRIGSIDAHPLGVAFLTRSLPTLQGLTSPHDLWAHPSTTIAICSP